MLSCESTGHLRLEQLADRWTGAHGCTETVGGERDITMTLGRTPSS
jgi:hypothetical protein